jgi:hypothetical protein
VSELYRQSGRRRLAKLVPTFADRGVSHGQRNGSPWPLNLCFLDLEPLLLFIQVAPQLTSRGWADPVPDPLLLRKSGSARNRTRDLCICSQKLWPLDHRGSHYELTLIFIYLPFTYDWLQYVLFMFVFEACSSLKMATFCGRHVQRAVNNNYCAVSWKWNYVYTLSDMWLICILFIFMNADVCEIVFYPFPLLSEVMTFSVSGERGKVEWPGEGMRYSVQVLDHLRLWFICLFLLFLHLFATVLVFSWCY